MSIPSQKAFNSDDPTQQYKTIYLHEVGNKLLDVIFEWSRHAIRI